VEQCINCQTQALPQYGKSLTFSFCSIAQIVWKCQTCQRFRYPKKTLTTILKNKDKNVWLFLLIVYVKTPTVNSNTDKKNTLNPWQVLAKLKHHFRNDLLYFGYKNSSLIVTIFLWSHEVTLQENLLKSILHWAHLNGKAIMKSSRFAISFWGIRQQGWRWLKPVHICIEVTRLQKDDEQVNP